MARALVPGRPGGWRRAARAVTAARSLAPVFVSAIADRAEKVARGRGRRGGAREVFRVELEMAGVRSLNPASVGTQYLKDQVARSKVFKEVFFTDKSGYNAAISKDKTYAISEGAVHNGGPCAACARVILNNPNLTNAEANAYWTDPAGNGPAERSWNFMAEWLSARY